MQNGQSILHVSFHPQYLFIHKEFTQNIILMGIDVGLCNYCKGLTNCSVENGTKTSAVKICVFVSSHLGFFTLSAFGRCQYEARNQIWCELDKRLKSY